MNISLACDHGGLALKQAVKQHLEKLGHQVEDFGTHTSDSCDYSDFAAPAAQAVAQGRASGASSSVPPASGCPSPPTRSMESAAPCCPTS